MNLEQLKTLHQVVECGSISEAAVRLYKTQPAISMTLKRLEQEIGFPLFDRSGYRLKLTPKGKIYVEKSRSILSQMAQLHSLSESFTRGEEHEVKIAIEDTANLQQILPQLVPIQTRFPDTWLNLNCVHMLNALAVLRNEQADLAITPWLVTFESEGDFESKRIGALNFWFCIHKELAAKHGIYTASDITLEKLNGIPQITPSELALNVEKTNIMRKIGRSIIKIDEIRCFLAALESQLGWGPVADTAWTEAMAEQFISFNIDQQSTMAQSEIRIVKNRSHILGPCAHAIWESLPLTPRS